MRTHRIQTCGCSIVLLVAAAGCNSVLGLDDLEIKDSAGTASAGATGGSAVTSTAGPGSSNVGSGTGGAGTGGMGAQGGMGGGPCVPTTCQALGKDCGLVPDGCGTDLDCGGCNAPATCGGAGTPNVCGCTPTTCAALGADCGSVPDGCVGVLDCGMCVLPDVCGGGGSPNVCGTMPCMPTTCALLGAECGVVSDGCADTLDCGTCVLPETCGGSGMVNVCGCLPTTCGAQGKDCGSIPDGCGNTLSCGSCSLPETCGGGGTPNVCGCQPTTCAAQGKNCGTISDGCGNTLSCGSCNLPETCGGGGNPNVCGSTVGYDCTAPSGNVPPLKLTNVATGLNGPLLAKSSPGDNTRLYIVEQGGVIRILQGGQVLGTPFLNVANVITASGERGLLGLAFHPNYAQNGRFFIHYSDLSGNTVIAEYVRSANPNVANPNPVGTVMTQTQPYANHNGGSIEFGSDGMLYIALGDGGSGGDPQNHAQDVNSRLGKILRIDITTLPFTPMGNYPGGLPEVWDIGMRNPFRMSFDACNGNLYIGDVGQDAHEEIDFEPALQGNKNYGWRLKEGSFCYNPASNCDPGAITTAPILDYDHGSGCAVMGGYVYRASAVPALRGSYFYGDYCSGRIWRTKVTGGVASPPVELTNDLVSAGMNISAFGQDAAGQVYVVDLNGDVYRIDPE